MNKTKLRILNGTKNQNKVRLQKGFKKSTANLHYWYIFNKSDLYYDTSVNKLIKRLNLKYKIYEQN